MGSYRRQFFLSVTLGLLFMAHHLSAQVLPPTGNWTGGFYKDGNWVAVNLRFSQKRDSAGTADILFPSFGGSESGINVPIQGLGNTSTGLHFEVSGRLQKVSFDGREDGDTITGNVAYAGEKGTFGFVRVASATNESLEKFYGAYRISPDRVISIFRGWFYSRTLNYVDYKSGQVGTLWPSSETEFFSGDGLAISFPVALKVSFSKDTSGTITGLKWQPRSGQAAQAQRIATKEERLVFNNGDIRLGGTLILPATKGPYPAIIITPGDFTTNRDQLRLWAHHWVSHGVAALVFDSRGAGESGGIPFINSFSDLANDVLAAVQALKQRPEIDPKHIGLFGFSNSAFTISLAASRSTNVAFLIMQSFCGVPPWEQESFRAETQLRVDKFPESDIKRGEDFMRLKWEVARTGEGWEQVQKIMDEARSQTWLAYTTPPRNLERLKQVYQASMIYDPVPALEKLKMPILAFWGGKDTYVPVPKTIENFKLAMAKAGNKNYTVKFYPNGTHSIFEDKTGSPSTGGTEKRFSPGLWKMQVDWLARQLSLSPRR